MNRKPICILIAHLFAATAAVAQESDFRLSGTASLGGLAVRDYDPADRAYMNKYQDLSSGLLTAIDMRGRGSRYWLDLFGENLGRDDQYLALRGGLYDVFKYRLSSDALRHNFLFNGRTPYDSAGSATQTVAPPFPRLNDASWNGVDIGYKRRDDAAMFEYQGRSPWYLRLDGNQVTWKGSKPGASSQGLSPLNGFLDLSFPVDYTTRNVTVEGGYNARTMHFDLSWMRSKFENENESIAWTNGFFGNGTDKTWLAADNKYTRVAGNATFRQLPWSTTLAARFTSDELESSVPIDATVLNTNGAAAATGASASKFDGQVKNHTFTVTASSTPVNALDTRLYYNYRKREDESTHVSFNSTAIPGPFANEPFSYKSNNYGFDAYYRFNRANRAGVGYDYNDTDRHGRFDYDNTKDKRFFAEWRNNSLDDLGARLKYQRLVRDSGFLLAGSGKGPTDPAYLNRYVTAFDLSNVDQDLWKLTLDWSPIANVDIGFEGIVKKNEFRDSTLGRLEDDRKEVYLTASYRFPGGARFTLFGDSEEIQYDSTHRIVGAGTATGAYDPTTPPNASNYNWSGKVKDRNWAVGAALEWPASAKLLIKGSAIYYKTDGKVDLALQDGVPASVTRPLPVSDWDDSKRTSLSLKAVYAYSKAWSLTAGYAYERYRYNDSQYDGYRYTIPAASRADSYLDGVYANRQYKASFLYGLATYTF